MSLINIESLQKPIPQNRFSLFELGFRPFFLAAAVVAVVLMLWWQGLLLSLLDADVYYGAAIWHSHEMVFGFAVAVMAGFLLTAVRNWTKVQTLKGPWLAAIVILWLAGRLLPLFSTMLPPWVIAIVDSAFLPLLALFLAIPILRANKRPQLIFVAMLMLMLVGNIMVHLELLGFVVSSAEMGITLAMNTVVLMIVIMAGRVFPMFTKTGAPGAVPRKWPWLEKLAIVSMLLLLIAELLYPQAWLLTALAGIAALAHAARLWGWHSRLVWSVPLLWVLHLGYAWLVLAFALKALLITGALEPVLATHSIAAAIVVLCLGMMSRVALGHTGRALIPADSMAWAFAFINLAMVARVLVPMFVPGWSATAMIASAGLWLIAFALFVHTYLPILIRARVDGQPG